MRRTPSELRKNSGPQPPLGEFYWKPTRQVRFPSPIVSIRGRYRDDGVHCERGGIVYFRDYVVPADPKTMRQMDQRQCLGTSQSAWKDVPAAERDAWSAYGQKYFAHEMSSSPGPNAFSKAQSCRRGWGGEMSFEAPVLSPPSMPLQLVEVPAPEAGMVAFRLEHAQGAAGDLAGYRVELRMTAATINGRKPQEPQFSRAGETAAESFFPLAESGAVYLLARSRYEVAPGKRFGLGARLITPEGIPGEELRVDLIRLEAEEGEEPGEEIPHLEANGGVKPLPRDRRRPAGRELKLRQGQIIRAHRTSLAKCRRDAGGPGGEAFPTRWCAAPALYPTAP